MTYRFLITFSILVVISIAQDADYECQDRMQKMKEFYCVSQCIGVSDAIDPPKKAYRTPPLPTSVLCNAYDHAKMKSCCNVPDFVGVPAGIKDQCAKESGMPTQGITAASAYEEYIINKWMDKDNSVDITSSENNKKNAIFCFTDCIFSKMGWAVDKASEISAMWRDKAVSKVYQDIVLLAVEKCATTVPNVFAVMSVNGTTVPEKKCQTIPWLFLQCVRRSVCQYCPVVATGPQLEACKKEQERLKPCDFFA